MHVFLNPVTYVSTYACKAFRYVATKSIANARLSRHPYCKIVHLRPWSTDRPTL